MAWKLIRACPERAGDCPQFARQSFYCDMGRSKMGTVPLLLALAGQNLIAIALVASFTCGCSSWSNKQPNTYVTLQPDSGHDTDQTRKAYEAARKEMDKHIRGEKCDLADVEKQLRQALATDVRFGPAHHSLGVLYTWQKKLYLAAWEFEYAARLMPDRFEPLNNLGLVYESVGKYEQAKSYYLLAREKSPNSPDVVGNLARANFRSGESVDEMRPLLEDVMTMDSRPEWRRWAAELLGLNPPPIGTAESKMAESVLSEPAGEPVPAEELPLIAPPMPDAPPPAFDPDALFKLPPEAEIPLETQRDTAR
jgi:Tfp pilus assembly protein PilF